MNVKKQITQTFIDIGNKEGFDNITINKIVKECNISRTTFYYHFKDIPDVISYYLHERISNITNVCAELRDIKKGFEYVAENLIYDFPEYRKLLDSKWRITAEISLYENWTALAENIFAIKQREVPVTSIEKKFLISFITGGVCHYVIYGKHQELSAKEFAEQLYIMLKARYDALKKRK